jgi:hypothetical protein
VKIAVELLDRVLCIELSAVFGRSYEPAQERVTVGTAETEISDTSLHKFGFAAKDPDGCRAEEV